MQPYDIAILVILAALTIFGFIKGMAWQIASLASVLVSSGVAIHCSPYAASWFGSSEPWNRFLAMLVLFLGTSLAIWILFRLVSGIINRVKLKEFDHQIGAIFGLTKGFLWCMLITFFLVVLTESGRNLVLKSYSGKKICLTIQKASLILPEEVTNVLGDYLADFDQKIKEAEADNQFETSPIKTNILPPDAKNENLAGEQGKNLTDSLLAQFRKLAAETIQGNNQQSSSNDNP
jgi:membrane protein required for colicin V production